MRAPAPRRASRLASLYPTAWRRQFPDFEHVLAAALDDHPRGVVLDVVRGAGVERLRQLGVLPGGTTDRGRSGLGLVYASLFPFVGLAVGMWSQLRTTIGAVPGGGPPALRSSDLLLAVATAVVVVAPALAVGLAGFRALRWRAARPTPAGSDRAPFPTLAALGLAVAVGLLFVGGWAADRSGWYSPAAAVLPRSGPGQVATLWVRGVVAAITPAWVHPSLLARLPTGELFATVTAPVAGAVASVALLRLVLRRGARGPHRAQAAVACAASFAMALAVAAGACWLLVHPGVVDPPAPAARQLAPGHTAWTVVALLGLMAVTALVGSRRLLRRGGPSGGWADRPVAPAG